jgi:hypothetical protein
MESQVCEPELKPSLSQLPNPSFQLLQLPIRDEAGQTEQRKWARIEQLWHGNLQDDAWALVILLQVGSVEPGGHEMIFHGYYQGSNLDHYRGTIQPQERERGHHWYLDGLVYPLPRNQWAAFVAVTLQRILGYVETLNFDAPRGTCC